MYHGFRLSFRRERLKKKKGYVVPSNKFEDASGIDFWVKMPRSSVLYPVQITQRGVRMFKRRYRNHGTMTLAEFLVQSNRRIAAKQKMCQRNNIAFVLVRDFVGKTTNPTLAWGDIKALRHAIAWLKAHGTTPTT